MRYIRAFLAGYASTLVFHQGLLWLLNAAALVARPYYSTQPVPPFGVPAVLSLSFWGGLWGIALFVLLQKTKGRYAAYPLAALFGAFAPSLVALAVVMPLKGGAFMGGWDPKLLFGALLLNGAWGMGVKLLLATD